MVYLMLLNTHTHTKQRKEYQTLIVKTGALYISGDRDVAYK